ncbi:MAG: barstar family protein [Eubacterium sp.]|nr:barstar family protein [Eubacterium sp.]
MRKTKEIIIDVANERYLFGFLELLIEKLELPSNTGRNLDGMSDFLREPWEEDRVARFINVSKTNDDIRNEIMCVVKMFGRVKEFQKRCGNEFTWTVED